MNVELMANLAANLGATAPKYLPTLADTLGFKSRLATSSHPSAATLPIRSFITCAVSSEIFFIASFPRRLAALIVFALLAPILAPCSIISFQAPLPASVTRPSITSVAIPIFTSANTVLANQGTPFHAP